MYEPCQQRFNTLSRNGLCAETRGLASTKKKSAQHGIPRGRYPASRELRARRIGEQCSYRAKDLQQRARACTSRGSETERPLALACGILVVLGPAGPARRLLLPASLDIVSA